MFHDFFKLLNQYDGLRVKDCYEFGYPDIFGKPQPFWMSFLYYDGLDTLERFTDDLIERFGPDRQLLFSVLEDTMSSMIILSPAGVKYSPPYAGFFFTFEEYRAFAL